MPDVFSAALADDRGRKSPGRRSALKHWHSSHTHESFTREGEIVFFMGTGVEVLTVGHCILLKDDQDPRRRQDYENAFSPGYARG